MLLILLTANLQVMDLVAIFRAKVVDVSEHSLTIEVTPVEPSLIDCQCWILLFLTVVHTNLNTETYFFG